MRRFSQRNQLVTLSDLNITPLLDLAFVLLIIFVIATPLIENGIAVDLPNGGTPDNPIQREDIRQVEIDPAGAFVLDGRPMDLNGIESALVSSFATNAQMVVYVRADSESPYKQVAAVLNRCERNGISRISLRTEPEK